MLRSSDDWKTPAVGGATQAAITGTGYAPGSDSDSAILVTLQPGAYPPLVRGKNNATGITIVEAFLTQQARKSASRRKRRPAETRAFFAGRERGRDSAVTIQLRAESLEPDSRKVGAQV